MRLARGPAFVEVSELVGDLKLHTVCQEARCPNIYECWSQGTATLMIGGDVCTRSCGFCSVSKGKPLALDPEEPAHVAEAVRQLRLRHVVITSVDRDDLPDGGAAHWAATIRAVRAAAPGCRIEVLIPDLDGCPEKLATVLEARPDVCAHNLETVRRLYRKVRPRHEYDRSLQLLGRIAAASRSGPRVVCKSGIMLGLGETEEEVRETLRDAKSVGVEIMTLGQYLAPTPRHLPIARWVTPEEFRRHQVHAGELGFSHCESGPLVRSSYHAAEHLPESDAPSRR